MINVKSQRRGWKRLRLPQRRLSSSTLLQICIKTFGPFDLLCLSSWWQRLLLAVGSNKLDFYFPHNGPRGPTAPRQNHCNTFYHHNTLQYSATNMTSRKICVFFFALLCHSLPRIWHFYAMLYFAILDFAILTIIFWALRQYRPHPWLFRLVHLADEFVPGQY